MYNSCNATLKTPNLLIDDHKIFQEHDNKNLGKIVKKKIFSSVSARKLKCPSSARLGTFIARLGSSRKIPARAHH